MSNDHIKSEISPYLAGGLTESRNRQVEAHAAACEKCRNALAKARAKQARVKREALKKASPDPLPNLFLARQGKDAGVARAPIKAPWRLIGLILLVGGGYWGVRHTSLLSRPPMIPTPEQESAAIESSSASVPSQTPPPEAAPIAKPVASAPAVAHSDPAKPAVILQIQKEWKGPECGIKESRVVVIRNNDKWQAVWTEMQVTEPLPEVNFNQSLVIGVFGGERPAGSSIVFGHLEDQEDEVSASYRIVTANVQVSSSTVAAPSHPYLLSQLPKVDKKIRLSQKEALP